MMVFKGESTGAQGGARGMSSVISFILHLIGHCDLHERKSTICTLGHINKAV